MSRPMRDVNAPHAGASLVFLGLVCLMLMWCGKTCAPLIETPDGFAPPSEGEKEGK